MKPLDVRVCGLYAVKKKDFFDTALVEVRRSYHGKMFLETTSGEQTNLDVADDCEMTPVTIRDLRLKGPNEA